jgi:hypothetical protein
VRQGKRGSGEVKEGLAADESSNREISWQTYWIGAPTAGPPDSGMIPESVAEC